MLNIKLSEIFQDKRSLTRIANIILEKKFKSNDLTFILNNTGFYDYIEIHHNNKVTNKWGKFDWSVYINESEISGLKIQYLVGVNYSSFNAKDKVGQLIRSKKWIDNSVINNKISDMNIKIKRMYEERDQLKTFCS